MSISIGKYSFDGPFSDTNQLDNRSGVYAILCFRNNEYGLVDVGESARVKERVDNHDRKDCWIRNCLGEVKVAVLYTPNLQQSGRKLIEQKLRDRYKPQCGKR